MTRRLPPFALNHSLHDRLAPRRDDEQFVASVLSDPQTRYLLSVRHDLAVDPQAGALATVGGDSVPEGTRMLLGADEHGAHVAVVSESEPGAVAERAAAVGADLLSLRRILGVVSDVEASFAAHAVALAEWHHRHPRCPVCGAETHVAHGGSVRLCPTCGAQHFPRTDPAMIVLVEDDEGRCLLGHNAARDATWYSTLAGFVEPGESLEDAVAREVFEETGVRVDRIEYLGSQPWPFPSSLMLGFHAHAATTSVEVDGVEITAARWFSRDELRREVAEGRLVVSTTVSISGALLQGWFGEPLPERPS